MKVIIGLGNPGERYRLTRHNIGANVAKRLARLNNISLKRHRYSSRFGQGKVGGKDVSIILPETYMNLSGNAVFSIVKDKGISFRDLLVVLDDADLILGRIRIKPKGSDGGHRGLHSIIESLGTENFPRLRVGIGKDGDLKHHVLKPFNKKELSKAEEGEKTAVKACIFWLTKGITQAMNAYNAISSLS